MINSSAVGAIAAGARGVPGDMRLISSAADIDGWWRADQGAVMSSAAMIGLNSPPSTCSLTESIAGSLSVCQGIRIKIDPANVTRFYFSTRNGEGVPGVPSPVGGGGPGTTGSGWIGPFSIASAVALTGTGLVANFGTPGATFIAAHEWNSTISQLSCIYAPAASGGVANRVLTNVSGSKGPYVRGNGLMNVKPSFWFDSATGATGLVNETGGADVFVGTTKAWYTMDLICLLTDNLSTLARAPWSVTDTASTTQKYFLALVYGPSAVGGARFALDRRGDSGGTVQEARWAKSLDLNWGVLEMGCDGLGGALANIKCKWNGFDLGTATNTWNSNQVTPNRLMIGAAKLAGNAIQNLSDMWWFQRVQWQRYLTATEQDEARRRFIGAA